MEGTTVGTTTDANGRFSISAPLTVHRKSRSSVPDPNSVSCRQDPNQRIPAGRYPGHRRCDCRGIRYRQKESFTDPSVRYPGRNSKIAGLQRFEALEGLVPGVQVASQTGQPGSSSTISIRGIGSINAGSDPLYIVDGVHVQRQHRSHQSGGYRILSPSRRMPCRPHCTVPVPKRSGDHHHQKGNATRTNVQFDARVGVNSRGVGN